MQKNLKINVYQYDSLTEILKAMLADSQRRNPSWSLRAWAKALKLSNVSSLSRVMQGQRPPNDKFVQNLATYYQLDPEERDYISLLALKEKLAKTSQLRQAIEKQVNYLAMINSTPSTTSNEVVLSLRDVKIITVGGVADLIPAKKILLGRNLMPIVFQDKAAMAINFCSYNSSIGSFNECYILITCRPLHIDVQDAGMFFCHLHSNFEHLNGFASLVFGNEYQLSHVIWEESDGNYHSALNPDTKGSVSITTKIDSFTYPLQKKSPSYRGYSSRFGGQTSYLIRLRQFGSERHFDTKIDRFSFDRYSEMGKTLQELNFQPLSIEITKNSECDLFRPGFRNVSN